LCSNDEVNPWTSATGELASRPAQRGAREAATSSIPQSDASAAALSMALHASSIPRQNKSDVGHRVVGRRNAEVDLPVVGEDGDAKTDLARRAGRRGRPSTSGGQHIEGLLGPRHVRGHGVEVALRGLAGHPGAQGEHRWGAKPPSDVSAWAGDCLVEDLRWSIWAVTAARRSTGSSTPTGRSANMAETLLAQGAVADGSTACIPGPHRDRHQRAHRAVDGLASTEQQVTEAPVMGARTTSLNEPPRPWRMVRTSSTRARRPGVTAWWADRPLRLETGWGRNVPGEGEEALVRSLPGRGPGARNRNDARRARNCLIGTADRVGHRRVVASDIRRGLWRTGATAAQGGVSASRLGGRRPPERQLGSQTPVDHGVVGLRDDAHDRLRALDEPDLARAAWSVRVAGT